jgi:uncharacterized membrane protein YbhN (UPF0104 family)
MSPITVLKTPRSVLAELAPSELGETRVSLRGLLAGLAATAALAVLARSHAGEFAHALDRALHASWHLVAVAVALEAASIAGYVALLHRVVSRASARLRVRDSYDLTLGGAAATRLLPTAGLGGAAVTVWALRARGVRAGEIAERLLAFLLLLYGVYVAALLGAGVTVASGLVSVRSGAGLGIPAVGLAVAVAAGFALLVAAPRYGTAVLAAAARRFPRAAPGLAKVSAQLPVLRAAGARARAELRRPRPELLGAVAWWACDVGVLATMLHAFGASLPLPALVLAYFLGTLCNLLPLPGSLSSGLVGALLALGAPVTGAVAAVLAYRTLAVWLPAAPGIASLVRLHRGPGARRPARGAATRTVASELAV